MFDQMTLFLAVGISCLALAATLLIAWLSARAERFLLSWSIGIVILGGGAVGFELSASSQSAWMAAPGYVLDVVGFAVVYAASRQFRCGDAPWRAAAILAGVGNALVLVPFALGLDGLGTMMLNVVSAVLLGMTAFEYWQERSEAPAFLVGISMLYALTGVSFLLCAAMLLSSSPLFLAHSPENWAEHVNAVMCLIGIVGVGALSLALNQARMARRHRLDASTDSLTGLFNRRALFDRFGIHDLERDTAVVVFDLDRFKSINDRYGHAIGDEVLGRFAQALRETMRPRDYGARLGGEEFALVMPRATPELAVLCAERIRALFESDEVATDRGPLRATVSAGVAFTEEAGESFDKVLIRADDALYRAKGGGRNRVAAPELRLVA